MIRTALILAAIVSALQAPPRADKAPADGWPTYNGDYTGRRFSPLTRINDRNVKSLSLAWIYRSAGAGHRADQGHAARGRRHRSICPRPITCGRSTREPAARSGTSTWKSIGGIHLGNRGVGLRGDSLYFVTPDCHLVSLNIKDGKERWHKTICDLDGYYYSSAAPIIVGNHVITGVERRRSRRARLSRGARSRDRRPCSGAGTSCRRRKGIRGSTPGRTRTWRSTAAA